jgi:hypothetical protein
MLDAQRRRQTRGTLAPARGGLVPFTLTVVLLALAVSAVRGGRLRRIAEAPLHHPWLLFSGLALQLGVDLAAGRGWLPDAGAGGLALLVTSQLLVVAWLGLNRHLPGVWFVAAGLALNAVVMAANGAMPVDPGAMRALGLGELEVPPGKHTLLTDTTRLPWLADVIPVPPLRSIVSVGDLGLAVGLFPMTHALMTWRSDAERDGSARGGLNDAPVA